MIQSSIRKIRHAMRQPLYTALQMTGGMPGASKEQQIQILDQQIGLIKEALALAEQARETVFMRDFDAHQAEKKAAKEAKAAAASTNSPEVEQTFADLIAQISGDKKD
jgi:hypothetical protein